MLTTRRLAGVVGVVVAVGGGTLVGLTIGSSSPPTPTVEMTLDPTSGPVGTPVTATVPGSFCEGGTPSFQWAADTTAPWQVDTSNELWVTATGTVPGTFTPAGYAVVASCPVDGEDQQTATFTVTAPSEPVLTLDPDSGPVGTALTVTASGHECGAYDFSVWWADGAGSWSTPTTDVTGTVRASGVVPAAWTPGPHVVQAACGGFRWPDTTFTVVLPPSTPPPSPPSTPSVPASGTAWLRLDPTEGLPGGPASVTAIGHSCPGIVTFSWDGTSLGEAAPGPAGTAVLPFTMPAAAPGEHSIRARCASDGFAWPTAPLTVLAAPPLPSTPAPPPVLHLDPASGTPGERITAVVYGHRCASRVTFAWDGGAAASVPTDTAGTATAPLTVPSGAIPGIRTVSAVCDVDAFAWPPARFTVTPPAAAVPWWAVAAAVALAALAGGAATVLRPRRARSWARAHVRVVPAVPSESGMRAESPPDPAHPDVIVRVEPHADPGTVDLEYLP